MKKGNQMSRNKMVTVIDLCRKLFLKSNLGPSGVYLSLEKRLKPLSHHVWINNPQPAGFSSFEYHTSP